MIINATATFLELSLIRPLFFIFGCDYSFSAVFSGSETQEHSSQPCILTSRL